MQDYVPDGLSDFAEALANPIKYQSELEKRSEQLAVLMSEDVDATDDDANNSCKEQKNLLFQTDSSICFYVLLFILHLLWVRRARNMISFSFLFVDPFHFLCVCSSFLSYRKPIPQLCLFL